MIRPWATMSFFPETRLESVLVPSFPGVTELFGFATLATERHSRAKPSRTKVGLAGGDDGAEHELALLHAETGSRRLSFAKDGLCCSRPCHDGRRRRVFFWMMQTVVHQRTEYGFIPLFKTTLEVVTHFIVRLRRWIVAHRCGKMRLPRKRMMSVVAG